MPSSKTSAVDVLKQARDLISQPYGWAKYIFLKRESRSPRGFGNCLGGAIYFAAKDCGTTEGTRKSLRKSARNYVLVAIKDLGQQFHDIASFNDAPKTRKTDVLKVLDKAIALAEKRNK